MSDNELKQWLVRIDERLGGVITRIDKIDSRLDKFNEKIDEIDNISREAHQLSHDIKDENKTAKRISWGAVVAVLIQFIFPGGK